jgi:replication-associated recombination protein RarA
VAQEHLPASLAGRRYYHPSEHGAERQVADRLEANHQALADREARS